jgi:hypothetical protein
MSDQKTRWRSAPELYPIGLLTDSMVLATYINTMMNVEDTIMLDRTAELASPVF